MSKFRHFFLVLFLDILFCKWYLEILIGVLRHNSGLAELFLSRSIARFIEVVGVEGQLHIEHVLSIEKGHFVSSH